MRSNRYNIFIGFFVVLFVSTLPVVGQSFVDSVTKRLQAESRKSIAGRKTNFPTAISGVCDVKSSVIGARVFQDYGAMFLAPLSVNIPDKCVFVDSGDVERYQSTLLTKTATFNGREYELQSAAMDALIAANKAGRAKGINVSPRPGANAAKRGYDETLRLWNSRFDPALKHWTRQRKISPRDAESAQNMSITDQVEQVLAWEANGSWFSTDMKRSILSSVAAPGTSQHLTMLAIDIQNYNSPAVREIMNEHGWFQTVIDDPPHYTYLGVDSTELPKMGLKYIKKGGSEYWVPTFSK